MDKDEETPIQTRCDVATVWAAPLALRRILSNLIQNAQRYAAGHPVTLVSETGLQGTRIGTGSRSGFLWLNSTGCNCHSSALKPHAARILAALAGLAIVRELAKANGWQVHWISPPEGDCRPGLHWHPVWRARDLRHRRLHALHRRLAGQPLDAPGVTDRPNGSTDDPRKGSSDRL